MISTRKFLFSTAAALSLTAFGCYQSTRSDDGGNQQGGPADLTFVFPNQGEDGGMNSGSDLANNGQGNTCGDNDPSCKSVTFDPSQNDKFPLSDDMPADPNASSDGVGRDANGFLILNSTHAAFNFAWTANTDDWQRGSVSKWDTKTVRELARYFSVTCNSLPTGNQNACDGKSGCCAKDSYPQFMNRQAMQPSGPYQQIERSHINYPSRTAIDFNGDVWVSNRALYQQSAQSSVTKIANDTSECIDRNKNGRIDTSKDVNGDGIIETDCNGDGMPDDIASVKAMPCTNKMEQEFYGLDDECVLLTTNTGALDGWGRPLALGPGALDFGPSDVWAGLFQTKQVFRIDGSTGLTKVMTTLQCQPYGFVVDSTAIGWAANLGPGGCYWDTKNPQNTGMIRTTNGQSSYGISLDRDQNIWFGGTAARYTPTRGKQFADLGQGFWTVFQGINGSGVAVDSRTPKNYFAYFAGGQLYQVPASTIPLPQGMDVTVNGAQFPSVGVFGGGGKGVDISQDGNVMVTSSQTAGIQRVKVDIMGNMSKPDLISPPMGNNKCPSGDFCANSDHGQMAPYTYSDFTGYGLRNYTRPSGHFSYVVKGCVDGMGNPADTRWVSITFQGDAPLNTTMSLKARSGNSSMPDHTWGQWIPDQTSSPVDLLNGVVLMPNVVGGMMMVGDGYLQVEADLQTSDKNKSPRLHSIVINYECPGGIG